MIPESPVRTPRRLFAWLFGSWAGSAPDADGSVEYEAEGWFLCIRIGPIVIELALDRLPR